MKKYLYEMAQKTEIEITDKQLEQFQIYFDYMIEMNQVMNLTAITEMKEVVLKHFIDSVSIMKYYSFKEVKNVIDVGTGAGFPGIPLAIVLPEVQFTLMDSLNKRIKFLNQVIEKCGLNNVTCIHSRAEDLGRDSIHREKYDICVSRAVANLSILLEYCIPFVKVGGKFISYKSVLAEDELSKTQSAQKELSCSLNDNISFEIPDTDYQRCFLSFQKEKKLKNKYPRQSGMPKKNPL